ncbi:hypothetical protein [Gordonia paraffinivorans]|uniref:Uncharacterized protein n=1 Tax=Gordonia paraffinivorans TaxID=175628 RepID=A0ABD7V0K0_9ACTN|nr:hypothetical protein [Gordonia paraffinivorans]MCD2143996.1 hypothetical protein [Gordonia paraffinivorans]VFA83009.1 Uncharacterised protein [Gordonia paraffinivorans]
MPESYDLTDAWLVEAARQLAEPQNDIERLIASISAGLNRIRRSARALATDDQRIKISDAIIKQLIAIRTRRGLGRLVVFVSVDGVGDAVTGLRVGLVARYADDLIELSDRVRDIVDDILVDTIGVDASAEARRNIAVRWQDVYTREWLGG